MSKGEAKEYAIKYILNHFPYIAANEAEAARLIDQVIDKNNSEIDIFFESFFGKDKEATELTNKFKDLLNKQNIQSKASLNYTNNLKPKGTVTRKSHKQNNKNGNTTSEILLKKIDQIKQKQQKNKKPNETPNENIGIRIVKDSDVKNFKKSLTNDHVSGLPTNLQQFENTPMTEESIDAMSKYFSNMVSELQVQNQEIKGKDDYVVCGCQSIKHGLYTLAPNCLQCGKIICNLEAKQSGGEYCVFCKKPLLSEDQIKNYLALLELDKLNIKKKKTSEQLQQLINDKRKYYTNLTSTKKGKNNGSLTFNVQGRYQDKNVVSKQVDMILSQSSKRDQSVKEMLAKDEDIISLKNELEVLDLEIINKTSRMDEDKQLKDAKSRLDKLLNFQNTSEERTKIIDVAGEFDFGVSGDVKDAFEGTAEERALKMKLKQRNLKLLREQKLQQSGKGKNEVVFEVDSNGNFNIKKVEKDLLMNNKANEDVAIDDEDESLLNEINILREKIYNLKLKDFELSANKIFDPSAPENKLKDVKYMEHVYNIKSDDQKSKTNHQYKKKKNAIPQSIPNNKNFIIDEEKTSKIGMNFDSLEENLALFI
ncbi:uncharacterized protein HGUI_01144 [Hanseniaspora guilliermondii]|uniref:TRIP4/RQT4 C2HC5-type zinc finger domain-containing protein n=1 Tax=Hanseniaspora guilliermondii TaxID=56406 RepID=A0A1L0AY00_9ASCO|nr:uncharacterized protein HGUI_01144 [Hanseniaspora guilliermondii]